MFVTRNTIDEELFPTNFKHDNYASSESEATQEDYLDKIDLKLLKRYSKMSIEPQQNENNFRCDLEEYIKRFTISVMNVSLLIDHK